MLFDGAGAPTVVEGVKPKPRGRFGRWLAMVAAFLVAGLLLTALVLYVRDQDWQSAEHARNYRALDIVGRTIEGWPVTVETLARTNFLPDRLVPQPQPLVRDRGFHVATEVAQPGGETIRIGYELDWAASCSTDGAIDRRPERRFRGVELLTSRNRLRVMGEIPLAELWYLDQALASSTAAVGTFDWADAELMLGAMVPGEVLVAEGEVVNVRRGMEDRAISAMIPRPVGASDGGIAWNGQFYLIERKTVDGRQQEIRTLVDSEGARQAAGCLVLNATAEQDAVLIADQPNNARQMETMFLIDRDGRMTAHMGGKPLPVLSIEDILPSDDRKREVVEQALDAVAPGGGGKDNDDAESEAAARKLRWDRSLRAGEPLAVTVAGEDYIAYFRPLKFNRGWKLAQCAAASDETSRGSSETNRNTDQQQASRSDACLLVGLVRADTVQSRAIALSTDLVMLTAVLLLLLVMLFPAFKLRHMGPAGDMRASEVAATIFGLVAAVALATLVVVMAAQLLLRHGGTGRSLAASAEALAAGFAAEREEALRLPVMAAPLPRDDRDYPLPSLTMVHDLGCRFPDGRSTEAETLGGAAPEKAEGREHLLVPWGPDDGQERHWLWPKREAVTFYGPLGQGFPNLGGLTNRCHGASRADVSQRRYFQRAMAGEHDGRVPEDTASRLGGVVVSARYSAGAIRAQGDGVPKIAMALPFAIQGSDEQRGIAEPLLAGGCAREGPCLQVSAPAGPHAGVALVTWVSRTFLAPVLPPHQKFMVVDTAEARLPYLFGSEPSRIGVDSLGAQLAGQEALSAIRGMRDGNARLVSATLDGQAHAMAVRRLSGTKWALIVYQPRSTVDRDVARTVFLAAVGWFALALAAVLAIWLAGLFLRQRLWRWLWPTPGRGAAAREAAIQVMGLAVAGALAWLAHLIWPREGYGLLLIFLGVPLLSIGIAWWTLRRAAAAEATQGGEAHRVLVPTDERGFGMLFSALLLALAVVPMLGLWAAGRHAVDMRTIGGEKAHLERAWAENRDALRHQVAALGLARFRVGSDGAVDVPAALPKTQTLQFPGVVGLSDGAAAGGEDATPDGGPLDVVAVLAGYGEVAGVAGRCGGEGRFCLSADGAVLLADPRRVGVPVAGWGVLLSPWLVAMLLGIGAILAVLHGNRRAVQKALFGFGTPLEATRHPKIARKGENGPLDLAKFNVVLNGQAGILAELAATGAVVDLGCDPKTEASTIITELQKQLSSGGDVVVTGLDVALREDSQRLRALGVLEQLVELVDARPAGKAIPGRIVVMTDLSPLDRILQAYEREAHADRAGHAPDQGAISRTEQLRWSRLFEDFKTWSMEPVPLFQWGKAEEERARAILANPADSADDGWQRHLANAVRRHGAIADPFRQDGVLRLVAEVRSLPLPVFDSLLVGETLDGAAWKTLAEDGYPVGTEEIAPHVWPALFDWAVGVAPATDAAAVDYLRGMLIEHYQHLWAASSHAERIILDNLARGRAVNIATALAIRSLIRRGLVRLDPVPRLMNGSFAAFVKQAERPEAIATWKSEVRRGPFEKLAGVLNWLLPVGVALLILLGWLVGISWDKLAFAMLGVVPSLIGGLARRATG